MIYSKFKQAEIGELPEGWKQATLGDISSDISYGYTASASDGPVGPKFLRITDIQNDYVDWHSVPYCQISDDNRVKYQLDSGDICIARTGASTGTNYTVKEKVDAVFASYLIRYKINRSVADPFYIGFLLKSSKWKDFVSSIIGGSAQPGANAKQFASFEFFLPALSEQRAIAKILSNLDEKIELNHQMNKTLEAMCQALFKRWFVDEDRNSTIGRLGDILEVIESGTRPKGGIDPSLREGVPSIGAENIDGIGFYDYSKTKFITAEFFNLMNRGLIKDYDVLVYKDGAYIGRKSMFGKGFPFEKCCVNEHVFILRTNSRANQFFLYFLLNQEELKQLNTNSAQPGLNQESMRSLRIIIHNKIKVDRFGEVVKPLIDGIFINCNQARILSKIRDSLLPKLMSGKIRVK